MTEESTTTTGAAVPERLDIGDILGSPFRDPRALPKFLGGCVAVIGIVLFGLGLLALAGYLFQTAERARRGEEHPMPEWDDLGSILGDGLRVFGVVLGYGLLVIALNVVSGIASFIPFLGVLAAPLVMLFALGGALLLPAGLAQMVATGEIRSAFQIQDNIRLVQAHLATYIFLLVILILIEVLSSATGLLCLVGAIPGLFWGAAANGTALGRAARVMGI